MFDQPAQIPGTIGVRVVERAHQHLVEHRAFEPGAIGGQRVCLPEIIRRRVLDDTALDMAALCGVATQVHPRSTTRCERTEPCAAVGASVREMFTTPACRRADSHYRTLIPDAHNDLALGGAVLQRAETAAAACSSGYTSGLRGGQPAGRQQLSQTFPLLGQRARVRHGPGAPADADDIDVVQQQPVDSPSGSRRR